MERNVQISIYPICPDLSFHFVPGHTFQKLVNQNETYQNQPFVRKDEFPQLIDW